MFTQSAFIRKNTPELREKLKDLGLAIFADNEPKYLWAHRGCVLRSYTETELEDLKNNGVIDCEMNENLFLALAALRDDSDYMQWFIWGKRWMLWKYDCNPHRTQSITGISSVFLRGHKATVEEIIEHFKK